MGQENKVSPEDWSVRVGEEELGRIFHLRHSLDQSETLIHHGALYQELGWSLVALEAETGEDSALDFSQSPEVWGERVMTLALAGVNLDLAVKTGEASHLLVLETPQGEVSLDPSHRARLRCDPPQLRPSLLARLRRQRPGLPLDVECSTAPHRGPRVRG